MIQKTASRFIYILLSGFSVHTVQAESNESYDSVQAESLETSDALQTESDGPIEQKPLTLYQLCYGNIPTKKPSDPREFNQIPVEVTADIVEAEVGKKARYTGDVIMIQGNRQLESDFATVDQLTEVFSADGDVQYQDGSLTASGIRLETELGTNDSTFYDADYQLNGTLVRGDADKIEMIDNKVTLKDTTYTSCPPYQEHWKLKASSISIDESGEWATAKHARLYMGSVPIFYTPYFAYPVDNKRRSGLLFPGFKNSSDNGFEFTQPFYWNIASNYDTVITPRYMTLRGTQIQTASRYLFGTYNDRPQNGELKLDYLPDKKTDTDRSYVHWKHSGRFGRHTFLNANFEAASDDNYLTEIMNRNDSQLERYGKLAYREADWNAGIDVQDFWVLTSNAGPHQVMPKLKYNQYFDMPSPNYALDLVTEVTRFNHKQENIYSGIRAHIEPRLSYSKVIPEGYAIAEGKLYHTQYFQDVPDNASNERYDTSLMDDHVSRTLPSFRLAGGLNFERQTTYFDSNYTQTLEPEAQYLFVPYKNQDNIAIYDSAVLQQDYYGLFRDTRYSGLDRIADANQITLGAATRFYNSNAEERLRLALGQTFYLESSQTKLYPSDPQSTDNLSPMVAQASANWDHEWFYNMGVEWTTDNGEIRRFNTALEYNPGLNKVLQLNQRYVADPSSYSTSLGSDTINQLGSKVAWPVNLNLNMVGSYYYDTINNRAVDAYIGMQYETCCWALRLGYQNKLKSTYDNGAVIETRYDEGVTLQFSIKGMGGQGVGNLSDEKMLDQGHFKYGRPFYLD